MDPNESIKIGPESMTADVSGKKILICDDDDTLVGLIETLLEMAGFEVATAADGIEAIEKFEAAPPDMILIDIDMPHKNGFEVLEELSAKGRLTMPLLVLSGRERPEDMERARQFGAKGFITKPFDGEALVGRIRATLGIEAS